MLPIDRQVAKILFSIICLAVGARLPTDSHKHELASSVLATTFGNRCKPWSRSMPSTQGGEQLCTVCCEQLAKTEETAVACDAYDTTFMQSCSMQLMIDCSARYSSPAPHNSVPYTFVSIGSSLLTDLQVMESPVTMQQIISNTAPNSCRNRTACQFDFGLKITEDYRG